MNDVRQCGYGWCDQFKFTAPDLKFCDALVLLRRRLTELLLQYLPSFGVLALGFKFSLFSATLEFKEFIDIDTIRNLIFFAARSSAISS